MPTIKRRGKIKLFGARLRAAMVAAGLKSAEQVAEKIGVTPQAVRRWMRMKNPDLSAQNLLDLSEALQVRAFWLGTGRGPISRFNAISVDPYDLLKMFSALEDKEKVFALDMMELLIRYRDT